MAIIIYLLQHVINNLHDQKSNSKLITEDSNCNF